MDIDDPRPSGLILRIIYDDLPDLIELEARAAWGGWSGIATAYTSPGSLSEEARGLSEWARNLAGEYVIVAGADTGIGFIRLHWYAIDRAGHIACQVRFAAPGPGARRSQVWRLELGFLVEAHAVEQFSRQVLSMVHALEGEAVLPAAD